MLGARWDMDQVRRDNPRWDDEEIKAQITEPHHGVDIKGGFDAASIMTYEIPARWLIGATIEVKLNHELSPQDIAGIRRLYPGRGDDAARVAELEEKVRKLEAEKLRAGGRFTGTDGDEESMPDLERLTISGKCGDYGGRKPGDVPCGNPAGKETGRCRHHAVDGGKRTGGAPAGGGAGSSGVKGTAASVPAAASFCGAPTDKGTPCQRRVPAGEHCYQHKAKA